MGRAIWAGGPATGGSALRTGGDGLTVMVERAGEQVPEVRWSADLGSTARILLASQPPGSLVMSCAPRFEIGPVTLRVFDADDGRPRWSTELRLGAGQRWVVAGDTVVVGGDDELGRPQLSGYGLADGRRRWTHVVGGTGLAAPVVHPDWPDTVLVAVPSTSDRQVQAIDPIGGRLRWELPAISFAPAPGGEVALTDGTSVALVERLTGTVRWRHAAHASWPATLVAAGGLVLLAGDGSLRAWDAEGAGLRWRTSAPQPLSFAADLGDGRLALGDRRGGRVVEASTGRMLRPLAQRPVAAVRGAGGTWLLGVDSLRSVVMSAQHGDAWTLDAGPGRNQPGGIAAGAGGTGADEGPGAVPRLGAPLPGPPHARQLLADVIVVPRGPAVVAHELDGLRPRWSVPVARAGARVEVVAAGPLLVVHDGDSTLVALH